MSIEETINALLGMRPAPRIIYLADNPKLSRYLAGDIRALIGKPLKIIADDSKGFWLCQAPDGSFADIYQEEIKY